MYGKLLMALIAVMVLDVSGVAGLLTAERNPMLFGDWFSMIHAGVAVFILAGAGAAILLYLIFKLIAKLEAKDA